MALTQNDKDFIKQLLDDVLEYKLDEKIGEKVKEYVGSLPTKEEFNSRMDEIMGELKTIREEMTMLSGRTYDNTDRLDQLEKIHPDYTHVAFTS
jgi:predicted nuclease with TOPRIM domain